MVLIDGKTIEEFLDENGSMHEHIRTNILTATLNYNHRVKAFIRQIVMNTMSDLRVNHYSYRVEFQLRVSDQNYLFDIKLISHCFQGAAHIHGVLFLDIEAIQKKEINRGNHVFEKLISAFNTLSSDENPSDEEKDAISAFADKFITVTLKDPMTQKIASKVQRHRHTKTCERPGVKCRFDFPKPPSLITMLTVPTRITVPDEVERTGLHSLMRLVLSKVKSVLENEEIMEEIISIHQDDFEELVHYRDIATRSQRIIEDPHFKNQILKKIEGDSGQNIGEALLGNLVQLMSVYKAKAEEFSVDEVDWRRERLLAVLREADVADNLAVDESAEQEDWNVDILNKYHALLRHSVKGFGIVLTRDVDEVWINKYNAEFLEIWDGNIDVALVFDMYAVVTYIADYYMKVLLIFNSKYL